MALNWQDRGERLRRRRALRRLLLLVVVTALACAAAVSANPTRPWCTGRDCVCQMAVRLTLARPTDCAVDR